MYVVEKENCGQVVVVSRRNRRSDYILYRVNRLFVESVCGEIHRIGNGSSRLCFLVLMGRRICVAGLATLRRGGINPGGYS